MPMVHLIAPHYQRKSFFRPRRPRKAWRGTWCFIRRYQLLELLVLTGGIALVWLGAQTDNRSTASNAQPAGVESASADLTIGVPVGSRPNQRPL
jgi:hypothetical protein